MYFIYSILLAGLCLLGPQNLIALPDPYYRSIRSGLWSDVTLWESAQDAAFSVGVRPALNSPDYTFGSIFITTGDTVLINASLAIDEVVVENGGMLVYGNFPSSVLTIKEGSGIDLIVNGTFEDSGPVNIIWESASVSWALGESATIVRTKSTSATQWRDHYDQGIATIPPSSNWVIRKQSADQPSIAGVNFYYGNLRIENNSSSLWNATLVGSKITGINSAPVIKGNFEIGTTGMNGVKFYTQNSAANRILVKGNLVVGQGSEFQFEDASTTAGASGIALEGDLIVHGILSYDLSEASDQNRMVVFSGKTNQYISGNGAMHVYNLSNQKTSGALILQRSISVDNKLFLNSGVLDLNEHLLEIRNSSALAVVRMNGWVKSEKTTNASRFSWVIGAAVGLHEFPFGKDENSYIPFYLSVSSGDVGTVTVATYGTNTDNQPFPVLPELVTNLDLNGNENSAHAIDRFWHLTKTGATGMATLTFSFAASEALSNGSSIVASRYSSTSNVWEPPLCCQTYEEIQRKLTVPNVQNFSAWVLMEENDALGIEKEEILRKQEIGQPFIYPNPFRDELFITYGKEREGPVHIEVMDALGITLVEEDFNANTGVSVFRIDFPEYFEKGMYFLKLTDFFSVKEFKILRE